MKKLFFIAASVLMFTACKSNKAPESQEETTTAATPVESAAAAEATPGGRFDDKSGILITTTDMMGMGKMTLKMTFDDYGKKVLNEMNMSMMGKEIHSKSLIKDGYAYSWTEPATSSMKVKLENGKLDEKSIDYKNLTEEMRKKLNMKEEGDETIDGKTCKVYTFSFENGMAGKSWVWKGLPIQSEVTISGKKVTSKFVSYESNVSVPSAAFDVPDGIDFKEMDASKAKEIASK